MKKNHIVLAAAASAVIMVAPLALGAVNVFTPAQTTYADPAPTNPLSADEQTQATAARTQLETLVNVIGKDPLDPTNEVKATDGTPIIASSAEQLDRAKAMLNQGTWDGYNYSNAENGTFTRNGGTPQPMTANVYDWQKGQLITALVNSTKPLTVAESQYLVNNVPAVQASTAVSNDNQASVAQKAIPSAQPTNSVKYEAASDNAVKVAIAKAAKAVVDDAKVNGQTDPAVVKAAQDALNAFGTASTSDKSALNDAIAKFANTFTNPTLAQTAANAIAKELAKSATASPAVIQQATNALNKAVSDATSYTPASSYTNQATTPAATTKPAEVTPVKKNAGVTIKGVAKTTEGTPVYDSNFAATGRTLPKNTNWKVSNVTVAPNGDVFYKVGTNQYVRADAAKLNTNAAQDLKGDTSIAVKKVATVKYVPGYGIQVWKNDFKTMVKNADGSAKKLADKTSWKVSGIVKHNGHVFYRVGSNQYIDASYATLK